MHLHLRQTSGAGSSSAFDAEDSSDMQLKRRSLLRSAGTASSPDLATLVRKAKAKAAAAAGMNGGGGQTEEVKNNNRQK